MYSDFTPNTNSLRMLSENILMSGVCVYRVTFLSLDPGDSDLTQDKTRTSLQNEEPH